MAECSLFFLGSYLKADLQFKSQLYVQIQLSFGYQISLDAAVFSSICKNFPQYIPIGVALATIPDLPLYSQLSGPEQEYY